MAIVVSKKVVIAQIKVPGLHYWSGAPEAVSFLASPHRHVFTVRAEWDVAGADREVEFFIAQSWLDKVIAHEWPVDEVGCVVFGPTSCEMIACAIANALDIMPKNGFAQKPRAPSAVSVFEDDADGARVEFVVTE